jgi:hypothetical protein
LPSRATGIVIIKYVVVEVLESTLGEMVISAFESLRHRISLKYVVVEVLEATQGVMVISAFESLWHRIVCGGEALETTKKNLVLCLRESQIKKYVVVEASKPPRVLCYLRLREPQASKTKKNLVLCLREPQASNIVKYVVVEVLETTQGVMVISAFESLRHRIVCGG